MDFQKVEFYRLNKNSEDIVYNFATEMIIYRKETTPEGAVRIIEIRKQDGKKSQTKRIVPSYEMNVEDFDTWKKKLVEDAHEEINKDKRETRANVSIENLLETDLVCVESVEEEYLRAEEEKHALPKTMAVAFDILDVLTPKQRSRYLKHKMHGMTTRAIAAEEGCAHKQVEKSIAQAQEKIEKEREKRGY